MQQALKAGRDVGKPGKHQLPRRGKASGFEGAHDARVTLVGVFGIDAGQRVAIALAPARKAAVFVGVRAGRHLQRPFVHEQVRIHGKPRRLTGIQQDALGFFEADGFGPDELRGKTVQPVGGHVFVGFEREFVGGFSEPGGQRQDARQLADLAFLAQQSGEL